MAVAIVPRPESLRELPTTFLLDAAAVIVADPDCSRIAEQLVRWLRTSTGHPIPVLGEPPSGASAIHVSTSTVCGRGLRRSADRG